MLAPPIFSLPPSIFVAVTMPVMAPVSLSVTARSCGAKKNPVVQLGSAQKKLRPTSKSMTIRLSAEPTVIGRSTTAYNGAPVEYQPHATGISAPFFAVTRDWEVCTYIRTARYAADESEDSPSRVVRPCWRSSRLTARFGDATVTQLPSPVVSADVVASMRSMKRSTRPTISYGNGASVSSTDVRPVSCVDDGSA